MVSTTLVYIIASTAIIVVGLLIALASRSKSKPVEKEPESPGEESKGNGKKGKKKGSGKAKPTEEKKSAPAESEDHHQPTIKELKKHQAKVSHPKRTHKHVHPEHQRYLSGFKGFHEEMTDFDVNGNFLTISSKDKTVKIFDLSTITNENPHYWLAHVEGNYASAVSLSDDGLTIVWALSNDRTLEFLSFNKDAEDKRDIFIKRKKFAGGIHKDEIKKVKIYPKFLVSVGGERDTNIKVWDFDGNCLHTLNTDLVNHYYVNFGVSEKFIFFGTWSPDGRAYEISVEKGKTAGTFKSLQKVMTFGGHRKGIRTFMVNNLETLAATVSEDQTIRVWDINVKYEMHQDPKCIKTIETKNKEIFPNNEITAIAIYTREADSKTILALGGGNNIVIASLDQLKIIERIDGAHSDECTIAELKFINVGKHVYLLSHGKEDIRINIFKIF
jgi:WD40 repeat protein